MWHLQHNKMFQINSFISAPSQKRWREARVRSVKLKNFAYTHEVIWKRTRANDYEGNTHHTLLPYFPLLEARKVIKIDKVWTQMNDFSGHEHSFITRSVCKNAELDHVCELFHGHHFSHLRTLFTVHTMYLPNLILKNWWQMQPCGKLSVSK